jgi:hypothetical protein
MGSLGKVTGQVGLAHTHKNHIAIAQQTRRIDDHQFGG